MRSNKQKLTARVLSELPMQGGEGDRVAFGPLPHAERAAERR